MKRRPSITTPCVADRYAGPQERIAEVSLPDGRGCLISVAANGTICVYAMGRDGSDAGATVHYRGGKIALPAGSGITIDLPGGAA